jgi:hypothetical protein
MLLPIKLATTKQPAKKKGKITPVTPEEQAKGFEGLKRQAKLEEQQIAEFVAKQNYNPAEEARKRGVSVPVQPYESKLNTGVLAEPVLSGEESVAKAQTEPKVAPRVQVNKQGLVVKTIETKYGNVKYTTTPEESKVYLSSDIDAINKLTAEIAKDFEKGFREQGRKKKTETKEKYKFDEVNAALNPNFVDEQTRKGVKAFEDVLLAPFDTFGIRKSLNEVADYAKQSDNALAQFSGGVLESVANPLTTFAMSTGNIADPTATTEQKVGAGLNLATYLVSAIPVGETVSASINAYRGVRGLAGVGEGINAGAKALLRSVVPGGKIIDRKVTINDLVNVLERNGQMGGKTRRQLAKEFASGGKAFARATGQAPELFYNKYLNDLADQAQPATPAQFDITASKAPEAPTQVEDLGTVVDDLVAKTEPVVTEPIAPVVEPPVTPPTSIVDEIEQGMGASKSTAPPPPIEPTVTGIAETPEPITSGISNKANLSSEELGLISEAPQGKGRSASQVVEETINRNPSDKELEILAGKVANGQALNADDTAVLLVGQGRFNLRVFNAREALDNAIKSGASAQDIDQLRDAWLLAQADATNFAKQIQKGKSGWSDVGRVLQQKTDLFTGELSQIKANIIAEAELRKGRTLTDAEQENYKTMIDKLIGENKKLEEELAKLKVTRSQATGEGRVRRTRTLDNLDKSIAQKENKIRVNKATVTQKLNNEIPVATSTRLGQFITEMKLLNPFSRFTDVESNTIKLIDNIVSTPFNMAVDQATSRLLKTQPVYSSNYLAKDRWKNLLINSWEKMKADFKIVAAGGDVETIEKYGGAQGLGSKAAGFTDVPFKAIYHEDGKFLAADVKAREMLAEELGKGNFGKRDIDAKRTEILENIDQHPDIIMNAEEYALNETFNNHNWVSEINKAVKGTVFKSPNARLAYDELIGRFSKVITNVAIDVADRTGLGVARGIYNIADAIKSGKNLTTAERMAINKMITKGMIGMPLMYLGIKNWDKIQGEIRGVQQKYIDYGDLGKLGGPIAIFLHGASIGRAMNELPPDKVNAFVTASSVKLPFNTPFVSNIADISDILDNPAPQALAKFAAKKLSNAVIPAVIREIATRMDTEKGIQTGMEPEREKAPKGASTAEIFKGEFMSKIPGLRQQLPLKGSGRQPVTPGVIP